MSARGLVILESRSGWLLQPLGSDENSLRELPFDAPAENVANTAADQVSSGPVILVVSGRSAFLSALNAEASFAQHDHEALTFMLENALPMDAEAMTCAFAAAGDSVVGVAVQTKPLAGLVRSIEDRGLLVQSISVDVLLRAQAILADKRYRTCELLLFEDQGICDLLRVESGRVASWRRFPATEDAIAQNLAIVNIDHEATDRPALGLVSSNVSVKQTLAAREDFALQEIAASEDYELASIARSVISRKREPWFELRRGALANGQPHRAVSGNIKLLLGSAALFLLCLAGVLFWKSYQNEQLAQKLDQEKRALFTATFPDARVPSAILSRFRSEHSKVAGSRRASRDVQRPQDAISVLSGVIRGLPEDVRLRATSIRISNGELDVDMELKSHADAGVIVTSLQEEGFEIDPPTTTQSEDTNVILSSVRGVSRAAMPRTSGGAL